MTKTITYVPRFRIKAPVGPPRRDKGLDNVIISETKDNSIAKHQVSVLSIILPNRKLNLLVI